MVQRPRAGPAVTVASRVARLVAALNAEGVRTHVRKADHYSGNILTPLGQSAAVRVSMCHYNSEAEVARFLSVIAQVLDG